MERNWLHPKYSLEELLKNPLFRKWVEGEATTEQKKFWDHWIKATPQNRELARKAQKELAGFSIEPATTGNVEEAWKQLDSRLYEVPVMEKIVTRPPVRRSGLTWIYRIAAVIVLGLIASLSVYYYQEEPVKQEQFIRNEVSTEYGERKTIHLSDGSSIILNAHSTLLYTTNSLARKDIEIYLEGEAYFTVTKRNRSDTLPFRVHTSAGTVEVLGTKFSVTTRTSKTRVVLEEGSISIEPFKQNRKVDLVPGELAEFDSSWDTVLTKKVNTEVYTSWTTSTLIFDETPLSEVVDRLEFTFGVDVIVRDPELFEERISGSIENAELEIITLVLSKSLSTPIEIREEIVYIGK